MFFNKEKIKNFNELQFNFLIVKINNHTLENTLNRPKRKMH